LKHLALENNEMLLLTEEIDLNLILDLTVYQKTLMIQNYCYILIQNFLVRIIYFYSMKSSLIFIVESR